MNAGMDVGELLSSALPANPKLRADAPVEFNRQRFLIVDDQNLSRQNLRMILQAMGATRFTYAANHSQAQYNLRNGILPSVVLCDYDLGGGRNGQQLLEELRIGNMIPDDTIFMMVTAERSYEQVVAAVELAPDDYILKPFTPEALRVRLDRLVRKKLFFGEFYRRKRAGNIDTAVAELDRLANLDGLSPYRFDILRARGEILLHADRVDEARAVYEGILEIRPFPWAKAGLARCLTAQTEHRSARTLLDEVIEEAPNCLSALDLKAEVCTAMGDYEEAQRVLEQGVARNPRNWRRQRSLSDAAVVNGDADTARRAMDAVIRLASAPGALGPQDMIAMARLQAAEGDIAAATQTLANIPEELTATMPEAQRLSLIAVRAMIDPAAVAKFESHRRAFVAIEKPGAELGVDVASAALCAGDLDLAKQFAERLLSSPDTLKCFQPLLTAFTKAGREQELRQIQRVAAQKLIGHQNWQVKGKAPAEP